ncbi:MAG: radical SAM protein [Acetobacteraceae bacterium]|nr:radical SAM protein [Acetobacteraceae bacterium]
MPHPHPYRWSRYARLVPGPDGGVLAFSGATGAMLSLLPPPPAARTRRRALLALPPSSRPPRLPRPEQFDPEGRDCLLQAGLLVEAGHDEIEALKNRTWADRHLATELVLNVSPTLACNLRCTYCFQKCGPPARGSAVMPPEVADGVVAFADSRLEGCRTLAVAWFGGEPLLALPLVEELSRRLRDTAARAGAEFRCDLFTNGTLLTPEAARRLKEAGVEGAVISLDGPPAVHDSRRPLAIGGPTFATIWSHLGPASEHLDIVVQTMLNRANEGWAWYVYEKLVKEGLAGRVRFRVARVRESPQPRLELTPREFGRVQIEGLRRYRGSPGFATGLPPVRFGCSYRRERAFAIEPSGALHRCTRTLGRPEWSVGHVARGLFPGSAAATRWLAADPFRRRRCLKCPVLPLCGGGCALELARGRTSCAPIRWTLEAWLQECARAPGGAARGQAGDRAPVGEA